MMILCLLSEGAGSAELLDLTILLSLSVTQQSGVWGLMSITQGCRSSLILRVQIRCLCPFYFLQRLTSLSTGHMKLLPSSAAETDRVVNSSWSPGNRRSLGWGMTTATWVSITEKRTECGTLLSMLKGRVNITVVYLLLKNNHYFIGFHLGSKPEYMCSISYKKWSKHLPNR